MVIAVVRQSSERTSTRILARTHTNSRSSTHTHTHTPSHAFKRAATTTDATAGWLLSSLVPLLLMLLLLLLPPVLPLLLPLLPPPMVRAPSFDPADERARNSRSALQTPPRPPTPAYTFALSSSTAAARPFSSSRPGWRVHCISYCSVLWDADARAGYLLTRTHTLHQYIYRQNTHTHTATTSTAGIVIESARGPAGTLALLVASL